MQRIHRITFIVGFAIAILVMMVPGISFTPAAYASGHHHHHLNHHHYRGHHHGHFFLHRKQLKKNKAVESVKPVRLSDIKINEEYKNQLRLFTQLEYDRLRDDIRRHGVRVAIDLNEQMEIVEGYHRFEISVKEGYEWIPAIIHPFKSKEQEKQHIHSVNVSRRHLNDFEIAEYGYQVVLEEREEAATRQLILSGSRPNTSLDQQNATLGSNDPKVSVRKEVEKEKKGTASS